MRLFPRFTRYFFKGDEGKEARIFYKMLLHTKPTYYWIDVEEEPCLTWMKVSRPFEPNSSLGEMLALHWCLFHA